MHKYILIIITLVFCQEKVIAQPDAAATYAKFLKMAEMFQGNEPYACNAIVEVKYSNKPKDQVRDTSRLIYKNRSTYYKSKLVERVEASQGELLINHELKTASFEISDSIRKILEKELDLEQDRELESLLDSNIESRDLAAFNKYIVENCDVQWTSNGKMQEISFAPKDEEHATLLSVKIRFNENSKVLYYEYTNREVYASDYNGNYKYRLVRTIYDNFIYENIPDIPYKLSDFLEWNGWTIKLKKYTNYKLTIL